MRRKGFHDMRKTMMVVAALACTSVFSDVVKLQDMKPSAAATADAPTAAEWQVTNAALLAEATADEKLAAFVADAAAADALLAQVKGEYKTDPVAAFQVGAVSQWVMGEDPCFLLFWKPSPSAGRKVWTEALLKRASLSDDVLVKTVCLDQLRWCGYNCPGFVAKVRKAGAFSSKEVKEFAEVVARELEGKSIGL